MFLQASRGLDKPAVQTRLAAGEGRELLGDCKEARRQTSALSFLPPRLHHLGSGQQGCQKNKACGSRAAPPRSPLAEG